MDNSFDKKLQIVDAAYAKYYEAKRHYEDYLEADKQHDPLREKYDTACEKLYKARDKYLKAHHNSSEALQQFETIRQKHAPSGEKVNEFEGTALL